MIFGCDVELESHFVIAKKQPLDVIHLAPTRRPIAAADRDMIPAFASGGHDGERLAIERRWHLEATTGIVAISAQRALPLTVTVLVQFAEPTHHHLPGRRDTTSTPKVSSAITVNNPKIPAQSRMKQLDTMA
jgi:hypothetical protein